MFQHRKSRKQLHEEAERQKVLDARTEEYAAVEISTAEEDQSRPQIHPAVMQAFLAHVQMVENTELKLECTLCQQRRREIPEMVAHLVKDHKPQVQAFDIKVLEEEQAKAKEKEKAAAEEKEQREAKAAADGAAAAAAGSAAGSSKSEEAAAAEPTPEELAATARAAAKAEAMARTARKNEAYKKSPTRKAFNYRTYLSKMLDDRKTLLSEYDLNEYRRKHKISEAQHEHALGQLGLTLAAFITLQNDADIKRNARAAREQREVHKKRQKSSKGREKSRKIMEKLNGAAYLDMQNTARGGVTYNKTLLAPDVLQMLPEDLRESVLEQEVHDREDKWIKERKKEKKDRRRAYERKKNFKPFAHAVEVQKKKHASKKKYAPPLRRRPGDYRGPDKDPNARSKKK